MSYQYIVYVSVANTPPSQENIDALLLSARAFNQQRGITGVLLCHKNTFFQFFEGEPDSVAQVYERIKKSTLHHNILELSNGCTEKRYFDHWSMGFCYVPKTEMQALAHADWVAQIASVNEHAHESFGLKMLKEFWMRLRLKEANNGDV
jgi:hypothetical protein